MRNNLVLSIFSGIDLLGVAFEQEGYCVVGFIDTLWGRDIKTFHPIPNVFEGIIGAPPCQFASRMRHVFEAQGKRARFGNLIPEFERVVREAQSTWFLMENVREAPTPAIDGYFIQTFWLNSRWFGSIQHRERRFTFGSKRKCSLNLEVVLFEVNQWTQAVTGDCRAQPVRLLKGGKPKTVLASDNPCNKNKEGKRDYRSIEDNCELQGLPNDFTKDMPFLKSAKYELIGNGIPLSVGKAFARAIRVRSEATGI